MNQKIIQLNIIFYHWHRWPKDRSPFYDKSLMYDLKDYVINRLPYKLFK